MSSEGTVFRGHAATLDASSCTAASFFPGQNQSPRRAMGKRRRSTPFNRGSAALEHSAITFWSLRASLVPPTTRPRSETQPGAARRDLPGQVPGFCPGCVCRPAGQVASASKPAARGGAATTPIVQLSRFSTRTSPGQNHSGVHRRTPGRGCTAASGLGTVPLAGDNASPSPIRRWHEPSRGFQAGIETEGVTGGGPCFLASSEPGDH